eukprot:Opistho-2@28241
MADVEESVVPMDAEGVSDGAGGEGASGEGLDTVPLEAVIGLDNTLTQLGSETPIDKPKSRANLQALPTRSYLDQTVVPVLMEALSHLARERPPNPLEYLAAFILKSKDKYDKAAQE